MAPHFLRLAIGSAILAALPLTARADALFLDGNGDYVTFPGVGIPSGAAPFTIEAWINPTSIPAGGGSGGQITFWGNQTSNQANGFRLRGGGGTRHFFWSNDHDENFGVDILPDTTGDAGWHHLALSWDGSQTRWYWNGSPLGSPRSASGVNVAATNHRIGVRLGGAEYFHGLIDEIRIWDTARSASEIADNYQQQLSGSEANLVAYFDFEGDYGDRAGGDNDGTPVGNATINAGAGAPVSAVGGPLIQSFTATPAVRYEGESSTLAWDVDDTLVSGSLTVEILAPGGGVLNSSSSATGNFPLAIGDTGGAAQTWIYTLRASESGGGMISRETTVDIEVNPGIPSADDQSLETVTTTPLPITLTGDDPNNHPNPGLTYTVTGGPSGGLLSGTAPNLTYTANGGFTGSDSFTFKANDGKYDSPEATVSIEVVPPPSPPTDIALSTTGIGESVLVGGFIAAISSSDPNPGDAHSYALVDGAGDADNNSFSIVGNQLRAAASFAGLVGNSYSVRLRSTDGDALSFEKGFVLTVVAVSNAVVINEVHYNPDYNPVRQEFIELYNPDTVPAQLGGWRLSGAVDYVFPTPTTIPPDGYLVIAEDPPTILSTYGVTAIGPFTGGLSSKGETVRLRDQNDNVVDRVDYRVGFPWPVAANGDGPSIELIHPSLDNELGSSWRSSSIPTNQAPQNVTVLLTQGAACTAAVPGDASDDADWFQPGVDPGFPAGTTGVGYENSAADYAGLISFDISGGTTQTTRPTTVYLRIPFTVDNPAQFNRLILKMKYDDGFAAYLNGVRMNDAQANAPATLDWQSEAGGNHPDGQAVVFSNFDISGHVGLLNPAPAVNVLAIHMLNDSPTSSDMLCIPELEASFVPGGGVNEGTPGARNAMFAANAAPNIRKVDHSPEQPLGGQATTITAKVTDPEGVASVTIEYQVVSPGAYIPAFLPHTVSGGRIQNFQDPRGANPDYDDPANWTTVAMVDDGTGVDALAGDDIYSVQIPAQPHRHLVRYRITVEDGLGLSARWPYLDDASLNFAYFHYDGVPDYNGHPAADLTQIPVYHILTRAQDWTECHAWNNGDKQIGQVGDDRFYYNWNGTIVYDGVVYDNIRYRLRGANGRYQLNGKRHLRFRLNDGYYLQAHDIDGDEYDEKWRTLTTHRNFGNRLTITHSLNDAVNMRLFRSMGVHAQYTGWMHMRVIDDADEAPDQWHGDFWGLHGVLETYDVRFLDEHDIPKGNLYKLINQTQDWQRQQRYQHAFGVTDGSDHDNIENNLTGFSGEQFIRDNVDLRNYHAYHAVVEAVRHYDYWPSANKNMVYYFSPEYTVENGGRGKLMILPWDTDATWGPTYNAGHDVVYNSIFANGSQGGDGGETQALWPEHHNVVRELRDLIWQQDQIEPLIDEYASYIDSIMAADFDRWKGAPASAGNYDGMDASSTGLVSLAAYVQDMKNFAFSGGSWPGGGVPGPTGRAGHLDSWQAGNGEGAQIPVTPTISYTGTAGYPTDGISFSCSAFADPQGAGTFGAMEWRLAEVTDPAAPAYDPTERFKLEIEADWESGELLTFGGSIAIPTVAVRSGHTYRARVRHMDDSGRWSHWSAPHEFTATLPDISDYLNGLVVSEVMYHPASPSPAEIAALFDDDDFFEYLEIANVGGVPLDLTNVRFTKGVDFDFLGSAITSLAPGERALVVNNTAAFAMRYGGGLPVAGAWEEGDKLDNGGEQVKLSFGAGDAIRDFTYDDDSPWPSTPDGSGPSLVLQEPGSPVPDHTVAANWRASYALGGTPGAAEPSSGFGDFQLLYFGSGTPAGSGELDDFDLDGISNLMEYLLGSDPTDPASTGSAELVVVDSGGVDYLGMRYTRPIGLTDLQVALERSIALGTWNGGPGFTVQEGAPVDNLDGTETVVLRSVVPLGDIDREFVRLSVQRL